MAICKLFINNYWNSRDIPTVTYTFSVLERHTSVGQSRILV